MIGPQFPARLFFNQRQEVGRVTIDLVGAGKDKGRVRTVPAGGFKEIKWGARTDAELILRVSRGPVMGGLGGCMNDRANRVSFAAESHLQQFRVANVSIDVF